MRRHRNLTYLASWRNGAEPQNQRDRLLFKLLGLGLLAPTVLGLNIEAIDVDRFDNLYTTPVGRETRHFLFEMDSGDGQDLWSIIEGATSLTDRCSRPLATSPGDG